MLISDRSSDTRTWSVHYNTPFARTMTMSNAATLQAQFENDLPTMTDLIRGQFARLKPEAREEAVQNTLCLIWKAWVRLAERGRTNDSGLLKSVTYYSVLQTRSGRTVQGTGGVKCNDPYQHHVRGRVQFEEIGLDQFIKDTTPVPDQVSFRIDVPLFLDTLNDRQQQIAHDLMHGMGTGEVARKLGVTPAAISQFRAKFRRLFDEFFGE
jgi:hypothetical protein